MWMDVRFRKRGVNIWFCHNFLIKKKQHIQVNGRGDHPGLPLNPSLVHLPDPTTLAPVKVIARSSAAAVDMETPLATLLSAPFPSEALETSVAIETPVATELAAPDASVALETPVATDVVASETAVTLLGTVVTLLGTVVALLGTVVALLGTVDALVTPVAVEARLDFLDGTVPILIAEAFLLKRKKNPLKLCRINFPLKES